MKKLTACVCDLSHGQAAESHRGQESVCAPVGQRERCVMHISPCQHQRIVEQEQAHVRHMLIGPKAWNESLDQIKTSLHLRCKSEMQDRAQICTFF